MKLRTTHNSIRLRLRKSELRSLDQKGLVEERIDFPDERSLVYSLLIVEDLHEIGAQFIDHNIQISIPKSIANQWIHSDQVSISQNIPLSDKSHLDILIEKDFPCLDRPNEDKSDTFWELAKDQPNNC